jgi:hypothetical protein
MTISLSLPAGHPEGFRMLVNNDYISYGFEERIDW